MGQAKSIPPQPPWPIGSCQGNLYQISKARFTIASLSHWAGWLSKPFITSIQTANRGLKSLRILPRSKLRPHPHLGHHHRKSHGTTQLRQPMDKVERALD